MPSWRGPQARFSWLFKKLVRNSLGLIREGKSMTKSRRYLNPFHAIREYPHLSHTFGELLTMESACEWFAVPCTLDRIINTEVETVLLHFRGNDLLTVIHLHTKTRSNSLWLLDNHKLIQNKGTNVAVFGTDYLRVFGCWRWMCSFAEFCIRTISQFCRDRWSGMPHHCMINRVVITILVVDLCVGAWFGNFVQADFLHLKRFPPSSPFKIVSYPGDLAAWCVPERHLRSYFRIRRMNMVGKYSITCDSSVFRSRNTGDMLQFPIARPAVFWGEKHRGPAWSAGLTSHGGRHAFLGTPEPIPNDWALNPAISPHVHTQS
jgi:hypothetical protein